ncbi:hypothetical protein NE237_010207 [Protea cynaroides]|uniref:Dirigent protein n=1 Tax=Protea cynaroides TaxID=273540 RepID=A0A9Q0KZ87_9MAGN|nr:hypothetical protein NE237_010207 [Protea cynaroides]
MAANRSSTVSNSLIYLLIIALTVGCANSARVLLDDATSPLPEITSGTEAAVPLASNPVTTPAFSPIAPADAPTLTTPAFPPIVPADAPTLTTPAFPPIVPADAPTLTTPAVAVAQVPPPSPVTNPTIEDVAPAAGPIATATQTGANPALSFYMHDILGGSQPSGRVVAGIVANMGVNSQLPFSRPNTAVLPINGGVPLLNNGNDINGLINNNNIPYLAGLGGASSSTTMIDNSGNNNGINGGNKLPFVDAGQLPAGATLQQLMFGTITVIDDELTEAEELGSSVVGKAQGFYLDSSMDGTSHTMAVTALFHSGDHAAPDDTISFFGVHRTATPESQIAVVGGTGKYENARGYANIQTLHSTNDHTTDGVETLHQFSVYISY